MADEEMSDEQIRQLLKDAEGRLREKKTLSQTALPTSLPQISSGRTITPYITNTKRGAQVNSAHLISAKDRELAKGYRTVEDPLVIKKRIVEEKKATAGSDWYNLPRTVLTPELKRDLQLLRMRDVLDPKRFYKKESKKSQQIPEYSQVGTIIEGPTEYFTGRLSNKDRKRTLVEEILAGEKSSQRFKSKYAEIQAAKTSGKKGHYKRVQGIRKK